MGRILKSLGIALICCSVTSCSVFFNCLSCDEMPSPFGDRRVFTVVHRPVKCRICGGELEGSAPSEDFSIFIGRFENSVGCPSWDCKQCGTLYVASVSGGCGPRPLEEDPDDPWHGKFIRGRLHCLLFPVLEFVEVHFID